MVSVFQHWWELDASLFEKVRKWLAAEMLRHPASLCGCVQCECRCRADAGDYVATIIYIFLSDGRAVTVSCLCGSAVTMSL